MSQPPEGSPTPAPRLILASASPRRAALLRHAGYAFEVHPSDVDEEKRPPRLMPLDLAMHLARVKARAVAEQFPGDVILGADTIVAFGDLCLGKPADADDARWMLELLSGTTQIVVTGVALVGKAAGLEHVRGVMSAVRMRRLTDNEIDQYIAGRQWEGKAGGYGIQDRDPFVVKMSGSHSNIVGLPMELTQEMLAGVGIVPERAPK